MSVKKTGELPEKDVVGKDIAKVNSKENIRKQFAIERAKDAEMVKGVFRFFEVPGGSMSFVFRKHKGDPIEKYTMVDGQVYTVPLGVAKHLNKNCWYPVHDYRQDEVGKKHMYVGKKVHRCGFQSLEFLDLNEGDQQIITEPSIIRM